MIAMINLGDYMSRKLPKIDSSTDLERRRSVLAAFGYRAMFSGYQFNPNQFSREFFRYVTVRLLDRQELIIFNYSKGIYELDAESVIERLIKLFMNMVEDLWNPRDAATALQAIRHDTMIVVNNLSEEDSFIVLKNGVLDLTDFTMHEYSPDYFSTVHLPFCYKKKPQPAPIFEEYLDDITCKDSQLKSVLQEIAGYCLCGSTKAERIFLLYGNGCNGKSVFAKLLQSLVGEGSYSNASISALCSQFGLAPLLSSNVNISAENDAGRIIRSDILKSVCSGDAVTVNRKYHDALTVSLRTKLVFLFNELPDCNDTSYGFSRKIMVVPFNRTFTAEEIDVDLIDKLQKELPSILNWAVCGLKRLRKNGYKFSPCRVCDEALQGYKSKLNRVGNFIEDCYLLKAKQSITKSSIYLRYLQYCEDNAQEVLPRQRFWKLFYSHIEDRKYNLRYKKVRGYDQIEGLAEKEFDSLPCSVEATVKINKNFVKEGK